ncbi:type VI secretion system membrane subunit TssM [Pseudomonas sp. NPDC090233]|uniref:type VI secretion system membrane subunit TssM n=1 Tax=Pseudomonas sp. NPDC090233 TaxID=3364479 RepID=UPI00383A909A
MSFRVPFFEVLGRLLQWLTSAWMLSLVCVLLVAVVLWYQGPLFTFDGYTPLASEQRRWGAIILLLLAWFMYFGWRAYRAWRTSHLPRMSSEERPLQDELERLARGMRAAMELLRKGRSGRAWLGKRYRYKLPWYLVIGAPGSGKTSAIANSGLQFPLSEARGDSAVEHRGETHDCDWWFSNEAVLLDTAGRYTRQDHPADSTAWHALLDLLRRHRPRRPVNGVIVTLSVSDLLQPGDVQALQFKALRLRIDELYKRLGVVLPVYVVVTQCDLLPGFTEFFEHLGREQRSQVWGMTFPLPHAPQLDAALASFPMEFDALERQLQVRVLQLMQRERDLDRGDLLYNFPRRFASIKDELGRFMTHVFAPNRYQSPTLLRGVYFTSAGQRGSGRSYFITRLMQAVICKEMGLVDASFRPQKRRWLRAGTLRLAVLTGLLVLGVAFNYHRNQAVVEWSQQRTTEVARLAQALPNDGNVLAALPLLDEARQLSGNAIRREERSSLLQWFGVNQNGPLEADALSLYRRLLHSTLMAPFIAHLETVLRRGDTTNQGFLFETLRVYLMLGERQYFDAHSVQAWADIAWFRELPQASEMQRQALSSHLATLLADQKASPESLDADLIAQTRLTLASLTLSQRIYNRLKRQVLHQQLPAFSANAAAGENATSLLSRGSGTPLSRGVNGLFTVAGYRALLAMHEHAVVNMARESWILDRHEAALAESNTEGLKASVLGLYYAEYISQWENYLMDLQLVPLGSLGEAARVSKALSAADSPLRAVLMAAARETTLEDAFAGKNDHPLHRQNGTRLASARERLDSALDESAPGRVVEPVSNPVGQHFSSLHALFGRGDATPLDESLALLKEAAQFFDSAEQARHAGTSAPSAEVLGLIRRQAAQLPVPLSTILLAIANQGGALALGNERERLSALWRASGAAFCRDAIAGRYPLVRSAKREVTADDFGKFFSPGGQMDEFFNKHLAPYVDTSTSRWRWRTAGTVSMNSPQAVLDQFQRGARIRDMYFASDARQPSLRFALKPLEADPTLGEVSLDIAGQPVAFEADTAPGFTPITLPSGKGKDLVQLLAGDGMRSEGPWAWLRLLDQGQLSAEEGERFVLTFDLAGRKVRFLLQPSSVVNPFQRDTLEQFRCPAPF